MVKAFGANKISVQPRLDRQDGINAVRYILPHCTFYRSRAPGGAAHGTLDGVAQGIEALRAYSRRYDEVTKAYGNTPLHNWASDGADAFRGLALVAQQRIMPAKEEVKVYEDPRKPVEYCLNDIWETSPVHNLSKHGRIRIH